MIPSAYVCAERIGSWYGLGSQCGSGSDNLNHSRIFEACVHPLVLGVLLP